MIAVAVAGTGRPRTAAASLVVGLLTFGVLLAGNIALAPGARAADADADTPVTVRAADQDPDIANAPFPDLTVTVSQTRSLVSQGIRLSFTGGKLSTKPDQQFAGANFVQVFQCWDDLRDGAGNPVLDTNGNPQPDRASCQYGSVNIGQGQRRDSFLNSAQDVAPEDAAAGYFVDGGFPTPPLVEVPFRSATGKTLSNIVGGVYDPSHVNLVDNEFYGRLTTNEVPWAGFGADGSGSAAFEVQTAMQSPGLGCGNPVEGAGGTVTGQPCWLVVLPRGDHDPGSTRVNLSGLLWQTWQHRVAIRLDFRPLGVRCPLGAHERIMSGSELASRAIQSWQPALCNQPNGSIYNLVVASESKAALDANGSDPAPLALVSRPLAASDLGVTDHLVYAPVALTGLTVTFAVDRNSDPIDPDVPPEERLLDRLPFTQMNLTPRLLAKLLTSSYKGSLPTGADVSHLGANPQNITQDPDFLAVNPQWVRQSIVSPAVADVFVPLGHSDSASAVWSYVMADPQAREFLAGTPDEWGMAVNPWGTTNADHGAGITPPGYAATLPVDYFPKVDPIEYNNVTLPSGEPDPAANINSITWRPYAPNLDTGGYWVLRGDGRLLGDWDSQPTSGVPRYKSGDRNVLGEQKVLGLTTTSSAARYQVYSAALENPAGEFVTPTTASMSAAAAAMTADPGQSQVVRFDGASDQAKAATGAYPLTLPVYAAANPDGGDAESRAAAASFIRYASGPGQQAGLDLGQLPPGYAPLPVTWREQARAVAARIVAGPATPTPTETPTPTPTSTPTPTPSVPALPSAPPSALPVDDVPTAPAPDTSSSPAAPPAQPAPSPTPTGPPSPVVGAPSPADTSSGAIGAAVPLSAAGGLIAAAAVPLVSRPRRLP